MIPIVFQVNSKNLMKMFQNIYTFPEINFFFKCFSHLLANSYWGQKFDTLLTNKINKIK